MAVGGEITAVQIEEGKDQQSSHLQTESHEWYLRASAEYSTLLISSELERIMQYAADVDTQAQNLGVLWMTDPFPLDQFIQEAVNIIERSDAIEDNVATLKNTVVRFLHASKQAEENVTRSRTSRRRMVRKGSLPLLKDHSDGRQRRVIP
jgi:hypothetical protein